MRTTIITTLLFLAAALGVSAQTYTVSGYLLDSASGEPLIGAAVIDKESAMGAVSGNTGFFSISLEAGARTLIFSYLGYEDREEEIDLRRDITLRIGLTESSEMLDNVVVTAHRSVTGARNTQMSAIEVPVNQIKAIPAIAGEVDVIKALQLLPGVQSGSEGTAGMYVRGGGADENLILMDGVPLYNVNHLFGFFSVFNADAVKNVTLYKGSFPARFGGRLSSVVDVRLNDGNDQEYHGNASIGLISSRFNLEGPIIKGKTTFNISARRTYLDLMAKPVLFYINRKNSDDKDNYSHVGGGYNFYDLNAKVTHKLDNGDRISLSFYSGDDKAYVNFEDASYDRKVEYNFDPATGMGTEIPTNIWRKDINGEKLGWQWGNLLLSLKWNHALTPKLYMSTAANLTRYRSTLSVGLDQYSSLTENDNEYDIFSEKYNVAYKSNIGDLSATADFDWSPSPLHEVKFGGAYTYHTFTPGILLLKMNANGSDNFNTKVGDEPIHSDEASVFLEDNWALTRWLKANLGVHASLYSVNGRTYLSAEPRFSARALITDELSFKASYSEMSQYIHLLCNSNLSLPSDLWVPVTDKIKPMRSRQAAAGVAYDRGRFEYSIEGYYKAMDNVLEYKDGASFLNTATGWEDKVSMGQGWSYGVELFVQKKLGKTTGWIGYTWARAMRRFDKPGMEINDGEPFYAKYDRTHDLSTTVSHEFSKRFDLSATFVYASGNRGSLAFEEYPSEQLSGTGPESGFHGTYFSSPYLAERNNYRMPAYNRLDLSANFKKEKKHGTAIWNISVYNAYNRRNPYLIMTDTHNEWDKDGYLIESRTVLKKVSIFPIIPSVSYTYKF